MGDTHHGTELLFKCEVCEETFLNVFRLKRHQVHDHGQVIEHPYHCMRCGKSFVNGAQVIVHNGVEHRYERVEKPFKCDLCDKSFSSDRGLSTHRLQSKKHGTETGSVDCPQCHKNFGSTVALKTHVAMVHPVKDGSGMEFVCDVCDRPFKNQWTLGRHRYYVHRIQGTSTFGAGDEMQPIQPPPPDVRTRPNCPQSCALCDQRFKSVTLLQAHMKEHNDSFKQCLGCNKTFSSVDYLRRHIKMVHEPEVEFVCSECGRDFADESELHNHMTVMHGVREIYICSFCDMKLFSKRRYMHHVRSNHEDISEVPEGAMRHRCLACGRDYR